jgi:DNA-binding winged helix-turn-helix (wHTH) protein
MESRAVNIYEFGEFRLDATKRLLRRLDGRPVSLTPRVLDTLLYMLEHHDAVLDKERIMEAIWPDSIVEENNLAQAIWKLRQVFGETPGSHSYIVTVPGRGYRFVAEVKELTGSTVSIATPERVTTEASIPEAVLKMAGDQVKEQYSPSAAPKTFGADFTGKKVFRAAVAAIAIVGLAALLFVRLRTLPAGMRAPTSPAPIATASSAPTEISEKSVAVLPFDNLSDEKQNAYFAAGVQDEITSNLARIAELKVISRTSANLYKSGNPRNSREIGQQLGVAHLLEGNVQRIGKPGPS